MQLQLASFISRIQASQGITSQISLFFNGQFTPGDFLGMNYSHNYGWQCNHNSLESCRYECIHLLQCNAIIMRIVHTIVHA